LGLRRTFGEFDSTEPASIDSACSIFEQQKHSAPGKGFNAAAEPITLPLLNDLIEALATTSSAMNIAFRVPGCSGNAASDAACIQTIKLSGSLRRSSDAG
jgi:hypothetical protein